MRLLVSTIKLIRDLLPHAEMPTVQSENIPVSALEIEGGFEQLCALIMPVSIQLDGLASQVVQSAHTFQRDASHHQFGIQGISTHTQNQSLIRATEACKAGLSAVVTERRDKKAAVKSVKAQLFAQLWEFPSNSKPMKQVQCKLQLKIHLILK